MHLPTLTGTEPYKLWLETRGRWSIEKCGKVPAKVFNALKGKLETEPLLAWRVRAEWVRQTMAKHWLELRVGEHEALVMAYPRAPHAFERAIDLREHARPSLYANATKSVRLDDETAFLMVGLSFPEHEPVLVNIADVLWTTSARARIELLSMVFAQVSAHSRQALMPSSVAVHATNLGSVVGIQTVVVTVI